MRSPKEFDSSQLPRTWGVAIVVAAALCIIMGIIVAYYTIKGELPATTTHETHVLLSALTSTTSHCRQLQGGSRRNAITRAGLLVQSSTTWQREQHPVRYLTNIHRSQWQHSVTVPTADHYKRFL
jgi:hypothetical protein